MSSIDRKNPEIKYTKLFINNEFVEAVSKKTFQTINPTNCKKITEVSEADKEDVDLAVRAAQEAFKRNSEWRTMDASARGKLILKLIALIERDSEYLAALESLDNGKPYQDSINDISYSLDVLRYYAGWCDKIQGKTIPADFNLFSMTLKEPIGVVGQILPWNYPIMMVAWKWGPALATGCTIVMKPAEQTPLTALVLAALSKEAGFPKGVINVLPGFGPTAGAAMASHQDIKKVAFTGSTEVGRLVMQAAAASNLKKITLELGGKSPLVIFNDCDLDMAVEVAHNAIFSNHGQNCCAGSRTFVQSGIYEEFVRKSADKAKNRKVGDPFDENTQQGPQVDEEMFNKILGYIQKGKDEGAKLEVGGYRFGSEGYFIQPTVFSQVKDDMSIATDEIFGPVQSILKFESLSEVIERANKTSYGLGSGVITKNINVALEFAKAVEAGTVWVNCYDATVPQSPFGGYKQSGIGRELGEDSLEGYLETKTVAISVQV